MSVFDAPEWDVNKASDKLNKQLFGSKLKKKQQKLGESSSLQYGPKKTIQRQESESTLDRRKRKKSKKSNIKENVSSPKQQELRNRKQSVQEKHKREKQTKSPINSFKQNYCESVASSGLTKRQKRRIKNKIHKLEKKSSDKVSLPIVSQNANNSDRGVKKKNKKNKMKVPSQNSLDTDEFSNSGAQQSVSNPGLKPKLSRSAKQRLKRKPFLQKNEVFVTNPEDLPENIQTRDSHISSHRKQKKRKRKSKESLLNQGIQEPSSFENHLKSKENVAKEHHPGQFVKTTPAESDNTGSLVSKKKKKKKKRAKQLNISNISVLSAGDSSASYPVIHDSKMSSSLSKNKRKAGDGDSQVINDKKPANKKQKLSDDAVDEHKKSKKKKKRTLSVDTDPENEAPKIKYKKHNLNGSVRDDNNSEIKMKKRQKSEDDSPGYKRGNTCNSPHFIKKLKQIVQKQHNTNEKKKEEQTLTLRERMLKQLQAARFRYINEKLYSCEGKDALKLFRSDPDSFKAYHIGYQQQVAQWPLNPLDKIINSIKKLPKDLVIADFGCGDARLARSVPNKVYSFDLVAVSDDVKACDMAKTGLNNSSVDIVVFCLSLMGPSSKKYILEANRVLKDGGLLKIAEVASRFDDVDQFITDLLRYGFIDTFKDLTHDLFYFMDFKKKGCVNYNDYLSELTLKPCLYKKR